MSTSTRRPAHSGDIDGGGPPEPHPFWARLESPLSTYYLLIAMISSLTIIGLVVVLSASYMTSLVAGKPPYSLFARQAVFAAGGGVAAMIASRVPVATWRKFALPVFIIAVVLQLLVFVPGLGVSVGGNRNWVQVAGLRLQPSEFGKFALILCCSLALATKRRKLADWKHVVVPALVPFSAIIIGLVLVGRDLGTALVMIGIVGGIMWAAGVSWKMFAGVGALGALGVAGLVFGSGNRMTRINDWLNCTDVHQCWQTRHGQFALADGGILGRGLGQSVEKWLWLPEPHNDFIYAIIGEELGLWGTLLVLALYALLALACYRIVLRSHDQFVRLATTGVMVWILAQAMINVGSVIGLLPVIGVPLPLVSYGGSALMTNLGALGMVIAFARSEPACHQALAARPTMWRRTVTGLRDRRAGRSRGGATAAPLLRSVDRKAR